MKSVLSRGTGFCLVLMLLAVGTTLAATAASMIGAHPLSVWLHLTAVALGAASAGFGLISVLVLFWFWILALLPSRPAD